MLRVDPSDGMVYTLAEMKMFYSSSYSKVEIRAYWDSCRPAAKVRAKVKAQAKVKAGQSRAKGRQPAKPEEVLKRLEACKVVPVIKVDDVAQSKPLVSALLAGGVDVAEITFRTACAAAAIQEASAVEGVCVGAGTVLEPPQVDEAVDMGADFIISPGFSLPVLRRCRQRGVLYLPAAVTPTEVMTLMSRHKLATLKFFPAGNFGGAATLKSFGAVFQGVKFMPTGGVTEANIGDYLGLSNVIAAGGSWFVADSAVKKAAESGDWTPLTEGARKAKAAADAARP